MFGARSNRRLVGVVLGALLVLGACTGRSPGVDTSASPTPATPATLTSTTEVGPGSAIAVAVGRKVVALAQTPEGVPAVTATPSAAPTTTAKPLNVAAIPRAGTTFLGLRNVTGGWEFDNPGMHGQELRFLVERIEGNWVQVHVPVRPNGQLGWVKASDVRIERTAYRIEVDLSDRELRVFDGTKVVLTTKVAIGTDATPTPGLRTYIAARLDQSNADGFYGPHILPTSAYSEVLDLFDGGMPVVAFHGTSKPELIGQAVSNGCIRLPNEEIAKIAAMVPVGTPVEIVA
ncbi:MAG: L,D-transpeptidase [Actinobacteria bacterium]|nr:L,D-transpeptidase [Actinomycetota bacterium]